MTIILPPGLPAARKLRAEGVAVRHSQSAPLGAEPLRVLLINLMPDKPVTETQFARLLGGSRHPVELTLSVPDRHEWRHTDAGHIGRFYVPLRDALDGGPDALVVTGAPVETLAFEAVDYWPDIRDILDWADRSVLPSMFVCWAAQAALYHRYGVPKRDLPCKRFGVYRHALYGGTGLTAGLGYEMLMPVSRHTETRCADLPSDAGLRVSAASAEAGIGLVEDSGRHAAYLFNHPEYDPITLAAEYVRDLAAGRSQAPPENCSLEPDPGGTCAWRTSARRLYANWLDQAARHRDVRRKTRRTVGPRPAAAAIGLLRHVSGTGCT
ncbi:homoserine O-acetyltransferase/O-succinyltransferase family protein [Microbaculum marinum]|uniref:Homoserine O-acetyltransferase n=1 Tax=Microbaculum marinum TaxID=1764581 RepID=A0AAW9RHQ3_9HYPH